MVSKRSLRILFVVLLVLSVGTVGHGVATTSERNTFERHLGETGGFDQHRQISPPSDGITVVATDSNQWRSELTEGHRATAELVAFDTDGTVLYYEDSHDRYWDVDPVPGEPATVEYSFSDHLGKEECAIEWNHEDYGVTQETWERYERAHGTDACTRNGVERVDLRTGEVTPVWSQLTPGKEATRYHDVDRLDETRLVVADIYFDRVFIVNTETDRIEWTWNASDAYSVDQGGPYPEDWTHINDVEVLNDGRIMVGVRNMDEVVFLDRDGAVESWTLGVDDDHAVLYEQHNPDFIPPNDGGPAVLVADSENSRVVEYQREGGEWKQTWLWQDARMQWPRDADRLPNGHTLITDSNANRVFEVDERGAVVWQVNIAFPYEAERLETGDESAGGPSAQHARLDSRTASVPEQVLIAGKGLIPGKYLNGLMYVMPVWMGFEQLLASVLGAFVVVVWAVMETRWALATRRSRRDKPLSKLPR